jgi:ferritin-like metal-binding protein YciE
MVTSETMPRLRGKVIDYLQDAHAMEEAVLRMLDAMLEETADEETRWRIKRHRFDTERHARMVGERLHELGASPSATAEVPAVIASWLKGVADRLRPDKPAKNARDAYVTEHAEIAAYTLLENLALRSGDLETARVARYIREDEAEMARWIAVRWEKFVDLTLGGTGEWRRGQRGGDGLLRSLGLIALAGAAGLLATRVLRGAGTVQSEGTFQAPPG